MCGRKSLVWGAIAARDRAKVQSVRFVCSAFLFQRVTNQAFVLKRFLRYKVLCSCRWAWKAAIQFSNFDCRHPVFDYVIKNRSSSCEGLCKSFVIAMLENDRYAIRPGDCDRARDVVFTPIPSKSRPQIVVATSEPIRRHHFRHISNISCFKNGVFFVFNNSPPT